MAHQFKLTLIIESAPDEKEAEHLALEVMDNLQDMMRNAPFACKLKLDDGAPVVVDSPAPASKPIDPKAAN
ncbi:MAG TPA: hypothetical protein VII94_05475 [Candidatus Saccharimonadales bacterium]